MQLKTQISMAFLSIVFVVGISYNLIAEDPKSGTCCPQEKASCFIKFNGEWLDNPDKFFQEGVGPCMAGV